MTPVANGGVVPQPDPRWSRIPAELRARPQWALAAPGEKRPLTVAGVAASSTDPATWTDFDTACRAAAARGEGWHVGYMLHAGDPFCCIDLDVKPDTPAPDRDRFESIIATLDSYTERSRSGLGWHIWVEGATGTGRKRDGVEVYSQERFIICTGDVHIERPVAARQPLLDNMVARMAPPAPEVLLTGEDVPDASVAARAQADAGRLGRLWRGELDGLGFPSKSEADLALVSLLWPMVASPRACWATFRLSALGQRDKAARADYMASTLAQAAQHAEQLRHGQEVAASLLTAQPRPASPTSATRKLVGRTLSGVTMRAVDWLWKGWIPKGYITIFAGETGAGKSTVLADVTARVTTGAPWPGEPDDAARAPGRVLWLGSEDSIEEMTVPRLTACGAMLANVVEIQGVVQEGRRNTFSMQDDLEAVAQWLAYAREQGNPFAMLVIDPVTSYLPGQKVRRVDMNDAGHLRSILEPWLVLAQQHNVAIVCVTHFAKDTSRNMLHRVLGSAAFAQTCRSLCAVVEPPTTEDYEPGPFEKAMIQVKVNLPEHPGGAWRFITEKVEVGTDARTGMPIAATRPNWEALDGALSTKSAAGKPRGPKSQHAETFALWLQLQFTGHPPGTWLQSELIKLTAIRDCGISESWWNKHGREYLDKENQNGAWMCRPRQQPERA